MAIWSEEELIVLRENYPIKSSKEMQILFPSRSWISIRGKARKEDIYSHPEKRKFKISCKVESCSRVLEAKGYCQAHYLRFKKGQDIGNRPIQSREKQEGFCTVEGCTLSQKRKGYCLGHYTRTRNNKDLNVPLKVRVKRDPICGVFGCSKEQHALGYCMNYYGKLLRYKKTVELINMLGGKCSRCQGKFPPHVYDFHHKDSKEKEFTIGKELLHRNMLEVYEEANKCELLCSNCHRERYFELSNNEWLREVVI